MIEESNATVALRPAANIAYEHLGPPRCDVDSQRTGARILRSLPGGIGDFSTEIHEITTFA